MTKITTVSKKVLSMIVAMIIALSCMASAFATVAVKPAAPEAIEVVAVFSDVIVIKQIEGCEYAILAYEEDAVDAAQAEYKAVTVFDGLEAETKYAVYARVAATETEVAGEYATIDVTTGAADADPVVEIAEEDIVVNHDLKNIVCAEKTVAYGEATYTVKYEIAPKEGVDVSSLADGSTKFGNLVAGASYEITAKIVVSGIEFKAEPVKATIKLAQNSPAAPVPTKVTGTSIEVKAADSAVVYACVEKGSTEELVWVKENAFKELAAETTYVIYAKYPANETYLESAPVYIEVTTLKASAGIAPQPVLLDKNSTSIKVGAGDDIATEFSIDGGKTWNKTGLFTGLKANTKYEFVARYVYEEGKQDPSGVSESVSILTNKRDNYEASIANCALTITTNGKVYAKSSFSFTMTGDAYTEADQYGDTRYVPVAWVYGEQGKTFDGNAVTANATAETPATSQETIVTVTYELQKFNGTEWVAVSEADVDYAVHVSPEYNAIKEFFENFLNFLLNFIPNLILGFIK